MEYNYLKQDFYNYLVQNQSLLEKTISLGVNYFFVWDFENQKNLWISNSIWDQLGFHNENLEDDLLLWQKRAKLLLTSRHDFTSILDEQFPKLEVKFKNIAGDFITTSVDIHAIKSSSKSITRIIGVLDNNWNNLSLNYSTKQFETLLELYKSSFSNFHSIENLQKAIVKSISKALQISRSSIWEFEKDRLICKKMYLAKSDSFEKQQDLLRQDMPNYFAALEKGIAIVANQAQDNELTKDLNNAYLKPLDIKSILDIPIRENGKLIGILCNENSNVIKNWSDNDISFARSVVDILSLFMEENKRRIAEQNLIESQERFNFISSNITDGIFVVEDSEMVFASKPYLDMIGLTLEEKRNLRKKNVLHLVHPDDVQRVNEIISLAQERKDSFVKFVFRCKRSNGEFFWREDIMNLYYDVSGVKLRTITITRDITEQKNQEIESVNRQLIIDLQNRLLVKLYNKSSRLSIDNKINYITKLATKGLNIDRSNYWVVEGESLVCKNLIDKSRNTSDKNQRLNIRDLPKYFKAMNTKTALIADDVMTNKSTTELVDGYLKPLGITDMLDVPVRENGKIHGVLCFEHRDEPRVWSDNDIYFARALADFLSLSLEEDKRKSVENELILNQEKLKFISENTSDGILVFENSKISYISPAYTKLSGFNEDLLLGLSISEVFEYIHPEDLERVKTLAYGNLEKKNQKFTYDYRLKDRNNNYHWVEDSANVIYNEDGTYSKYILISRDITERKKTEEELIKSEQKLRLISDNSSDGFVVIENHKVAFVSRSYADFMGYTVEELYGLSSSLVYEKIHPDDRENVVDLINFNLDNRVNSFKFEFRFMSKSGEYLWREDSTNVIYDENDKTNKYSKYIIISRGINERKLIEAKLLENENQLRLIYENTSDGIFVIEGGKITYISPSYAKLLQYSEEEYLNFTLEDIFKKFHPDDLDVVRSYIYDCLSKKEKEFKYELRYRGANGDYYWREDSANVLYDENGNYSKYIVVTRDVSVRKEAEKEKNRLYKITETQNEKLINFTHIVSHDIRSHTSNLSMILDLFEETKNPKEQSEYFNMLKESTSKLSNTIFHLNESVAMHSGTKHEKVALNLKKEVEKAVLGISLNIKKTNAKINIDINEEIEVIVTQSYLESIIFNLLTNAIKYRSSDRSPIINIKASKKDNEIVFTVSDNGIGIDLQKNKGKVFGMYKTFHGNSDALGLGLFMVKNHIEAMGGRIEIQSQVNIGTTFNLYFI
jgi:PAS domain S-box-containing protein